MTKAFLPRDSFGALYHALTDEGYEVIGPVVRQGAIVFDSIQGMADLPWGVREESRPGEYRLVADEQQRCFSWNTGPQAFKPWLFKPEQTVWKAQPTNEGFRFTQTEPEASPLAFIGVRSCDIAALYLQDKHFVHGPYADPWYTAQRRQMCIVAVNCSQSAETCFCVSTGDGPEASFGYDVLLDELDDGYLIEANSERGSRILARLSLQKTTDKQHRQASEQVREAARQTRVMPQADDLLALTDHLDDAQWVQIAERCLACGNCTSVCPTCFCSKQESTQLVDSGSAQQVRYWDSCFSQQHSHIAGKNIRNEISQRYRQWVLHKLATWQAQYDRSGCVGCGRCISWCPVAIDLVSEVNTMLKDEQHE